MGPYGIPDLRVITDNDPFWTSRGFGRERKKLLHRALPPTREPVEIVEIGCGKPETIRQLPAEGRFAGTRYSKNNNPFHGGQYSLFNLPKKA